MEGLKGLFNWMDEKIGVNKDTYRNACDDDREMILDCVLNSECFKKYEDFKFCVQEGADKPCKALRYDLYRCKRATVYWEHSLRDDPR